MITNACEVAFYTKQDGTSPVRDYLDSLAVKERAKVMSYVRFLQEQKGYLDEPYSKHVTGKIRELRVDFSKKKNRILYFVSSGRKIVLLHAFQKKTAKLPRTDINRALENYRNYRNQVE